MFFLDFDGTVIDIWTRYFKVFSSILNIDEFSVEHYKSLKKKFKNDELLASELGVKLPWDYFKQKKILLEDKSFLKYDSTVLSVGLLNEFLKKDNVMFLVKRRNENNFLWELKNLGISVNKFCVVGDISKKEYIMKNYPNENSVIIGDSMFDLEAGKLPYVSPFMVGYGLGSKDEFDSSTIDYRYLKSADEFAEFISKNI